MALNITYGIPKNETQEYQNRHSYNGHMTFTRYIFEDKWKLTAVTGEFARLFIAINNAVKIISAALSRYRLEWSSLSSRKKEIQQLEDFAHTVFVDFLESSYTVSTISSKSSDDILIVDEPRRGKYVVIFTPLDGKSSLDSQSGLGSIFSIYRKTESKIHEKDVLQTGSKIVAAGYALYAANTQFIATLGKGTGVHRFMLDPDIGEFVLIERNCRIPVLGQYLSCNVNHMSNLDPPIKEFLNKKKESKPKTYSSAHIGCFVADVHRIIQNGGIYMHPSNKDYPMGKLPLQHKCNPMSFIVLEAGGLATNGEISIPEVIPSTLKQTTPIYLGSCSEIKELTDTIMSFTRKNK